MVKRGRGLIKRYGVLFTCLAVRAIHIEVVQNLEADSFINALRRFIARRGKPVEMRSDNGTNFKGGNRELIESMREWNQSSKVHTFLLQHEMKWFVQSSCCFPHGWCLGEGNQISTKGVECRSKGAGTR